jgi:hypothetical protein
LVRSLNFYFSEFKRGKPKSEGQGEKSEGPFCKYLEVDITLGWELGGADHLSVLCMAPLN